MRLILNKEFITEIYNRHTGSVQFYRRSYCEHLIYTEGILDFQKTLNAFWFVDCIISNLPQIIFTAKAVDDGFFIVKIKVNKKENNGILEIYREGYVNNKYSEHITAFKQIIPDIDLIPYDYKFYLILTNIEPVIFTLLLPSEY